MGEIPIVTVPHPLADNGPEQVAEKARAVTKEIARVLTEPAEKLAYEYGRRFIKGPEERGAEKFQVDDSLEAVSRWFYEHELTDGLPIVPPTAERVAAMLRCTDREPSENLGGVPPRYGAATVEKVAINAVMAGCSPEYLPVIITAVQALLEERFNLYAVQTTTHPCAPLLVLNGPIARQLGVNCRYNVFGPGWRANATIGRAIRLILLNLGGAAPGVLDHSTQGQPSKYTYCIAENEDENPWEPLHVERGFARDVSTVTVCPAENPHNVNDHVSRTARGLLTTFATTMAGMGSNNAYLFGDPLVCFGPEHAAILARDGLRKDDVRDFLFKNARTPRELWQSAGSFGLSSEHANIFPGENAIPIVRRKEDLIIIVAGGSGRHSCWIPTFGQLALSVTKPITRKDGTPAKSVREFNAA
jgi:hypothetical protein